MQGSWQAGTDPFGSHTIQTMFPPHTVCIPTPWRTEFLREIYLSAENRRPIWCPVNFACGTASPYVANRTSADHRLDRRTHQSLAVAVLAPAVLADPGARIPARNVMLLDSPPSPLSATMNYLDNRTKVDVDKRCLNPFHRLSQVASRHGSSAHLSSSGTAPGRKQTAGPPKI